MLQLFGRPQWLTIKGRTQQYVRKVTAPYAHNIRLNTAVTAVKVVDAPTANGHDANGKTPSPEPHSESEAEDEADSKRNDRGRVIVTDSTGQSERYDAVVFASHAPETLKMLGEGVTADEKELLNAFPYQEYDLHYHRSND